MEIYAWAGFFVPRTTPAAVTSRLNAEFVKVLRGAEFRALAEQEGLIVGGDSPEEFRAFIAAERAKFARIVRVTGIKRASRSDLARVNLAAAYPNRPDRLRRVGAVHS